LGLPGEKFRSCGQWIDHELILGVRPEQVYPTIPERIQKDYVWIEGITKVLEPLGSETLVHLRAGNHEIVATCDPEKAPIMNSKMRFWIDPNRIHLFDPASEAAIV